jgi:hypothetical protein
MNRFIDQYTAGVLIPAPLLHGVGTVGLST